MLISFLALIYITFVCWGWGRLSIRMLMPGTDSASLPEWNLLLTFLVGASTLMVAGNLISIFLPLSNWILHAFILLVAILAVIIINKPPGMIKRDPGIEKWRIVTTFLAILLTFLLLQHHSRSIGHPDTIGYHAPIIRWIENFRQVPGIANLDIRNGHQSNWFVGSALFSFSFTGVNSIGFLNLAFVSWFLLFLLQQIRKYAATGKWVELLLCVALLGFSMWEFTQVRLTVSSASPDFIVCIFILATVYLHFNTEPRELPRLVPISFFLCFTVVSIKFSAIPIVLLPLIHLLPVLTRQWKRVIGYGFMIGVVVILPFLYRNYIASGFPLFPSRALAISNPDWTIQENGRAYAFYNVPAYARLKTSDAPEVVFEAANLPLTKWIGRWWQLKNIPEKAFLITAAFLLVVSFVLLIRPRFRNLIKPHLPVVATMLIGLLFWFVLGPDLRFGYGFFYGLIGTLLLTIFKFLPQSLSPRKILLPFAVAILIAIAGLTGYRFVQQSERDQWIVPNGIKNPAYVLRPDGIIKPISDPCFCAGLPFPCSCTEQYQMRGSKIEDGFKPVQ